MKLIPIQKEIENNPEFRDNPACSDSFQMTLDFYKSAGFEPPWICYYASINGVLVGSAGFKGAPKDGKIEIAYGTFETHRKQGIGSMICGKLVQLSLKTDPSVRITARTLPEKNYSTRILEKNHFAFVGTVEDPDDGEVWEWELTPV